LFFKRYTLQNNRYHTYDLYIITGLDFQFCLPVHPAKMIGGLDSCIDVADAECSSDIADGVVVVLNIIFKLYYMKYLISIIS